jgi:hypothetical protein
MTGGEDRAESDRGGSRWNGVGRVSGMTTVTAIAKGYVHIDVDRDEDRNGDGEEDIDRSNETDNLRPFYSSSKQT